MNNKYLTVDEAMDNAWDGADTKSEYLQQLAAFLTISYKFKYERRMIDVYHDFVTDLNDSDRNALESFVEAIGVAKALMDNPSALIDLIKTTHVEWYYLSVLESVFANVGELERFLVWVDVNSITEPLNIAFLKYMDHIYPDALSEC